MSLVTDFRGSTEPLEYDPLLGVSRYELARWRRAFLSELYVELRDDADVDVEPYVDWPEPGSFEPGKLISPPEEAEVKGDTADITYHFIIFWAKMVQKMIDEGTFFEEAALEGAHRAHLLEVSRHEARTILHLINTHLTNAWRHAQELYQWYNDWMSEEFPQDPSPVIPD